MLKIRLSRVGKKNDPSFRIVVTEHYKPVKSGFIEHIGFYNPGSKQFQIDKEKLDAWTKKGATCSVTVNNLLVREKIFAKEKTVKITRVPKKEEEEKKTENPKKKSAETAKADSDGPANNAPQNGALGGEETKVKTEEESVPAKTASDKTKTEASPRSDDDQSSAESTTPPETKSVEKKPAVDKK